MAGASDAHGLDGVTGRSVVPAPSPSVPGLSSVAAIGLGIAALVAGIAGAAAGRPWVLVVAGAVGAAAGLVPEPPLPLQLREVRETGITGKALRSAPWLLAALLLAARTSRSSVVIGTAVAATLILAMAAASDVLLVLVRKLRRPPLLCRNLTLGELTVPRMPPRQLVGWAPRGDLAASLIALGIAVSGPHEVTWAAIGLAAAGVLAAVPGALLAWHALKLRRIGLRRRMIDAVTQAVGELRPDVAVYFASTPEECYQPEMWLGPVQQLERPALVVLRDPAVLEQLAATSLPVVCTPYNGTLSSLPLPSRVVTLFVTHSGNNVAMLRRPEVRSVFVGHGDSDKPDSVNPVARVYHQVWVAGALGRRRYEDSQVGVRREAIVEIGRPQIDVATVAPPIVTTVLYAPTWEGWGDDPHHSSLPHVGPQLVARLLQAPHLRLIYRPHPLTGHRDPRLRRAHAEVLRLMRAAGAVTDGPPAAAGSAGDLLDQALSSGRGVATEDGRYPGPGPGPGHDWTTDASHAHRIVLPGGPSLASCFGQSSGLIGDVSSVVSEYLAWDRPYAVVDTRGSSRDAFLTRFPSVAGGSVIDPALDGLERFLDAVAGGVDECADARRSLVRDTLGDPASSQQRFAAAVEALLGAPGPRQQEA